MLLSLSLWRLWSSCPLLIKSPWFLLNMKWTVLFRAQYQHTEWLLHHYTGQIAPPLTRGKQKQECKARHIQHFCLVLTGKHEETSVNVHQNANAMQHQTSIITQQHSSMKKDFKPLESKRLSKIYFLKMWTALAVRVKRRRRWHWMVILKRVPRTSNLTTNCPIFKYSCDFLFN